MADTAYDCVYEISCGVSNKLPWNPIQIQVIKPLVLGFRSKIGNLADTAVFELFGTVFGIFNYKGGGSTNLLLEELSPFYLLFYLNCNTMLSSSY